MIKAYVLVISKGDDTELLENLKKVEQIMEARLAFGTYDIVIELEGKDEVDVGNIVMQKIRNLPNVVSTETILTTDGFKRSD